MSRCIMISRIAWFGKDSPLEQEPLTEGIVLQHLPRWPRTDVQQMAEALVANERGERHWLRAGTFRMHG